MYKNEKDIYKVYSFRLSEFDLSIIDSIPDRSNRPYKKESRSNKLRRILFSYYFENRNNEVEK